MLPDTLIAGLRYRLVHSGVPNLVAATLNWNERHKHIRFDFFFSGTSEEVDFDQLEFDLVAEFIGEIWFGVETVGFSAVFDKLSTETALSDPARLYPP